MKIGDYYPNTEMLPHQRRFHELCNSGVYAICQSGGLGSGKKHALYAQMLSDSYTNSGLKTALITPYDWCVGEAVIPRFKALDIPTKRRSCNFGNGSEIAFLSLQQFIRSKECFHRVVFLEGSEHETGSVYFSMVDVFNRLNLVLMYYNVAFTPILVEQNPKGHNWVWRVFVADAKGEGEILEQERHEGWRVYQQNIHLPNARVFSELVTVVSETAINIHLPKGYIDTLLKSIQDAEGLRCRMLGGEFNPIQGSAEAG